MAATTSPTRRFPCQSCGATLEYDPGSKDLVCAYCGSSQAIAPTLTEQVTEQTYAHFLNEKHTQIAALSQSAMEATCPGCQASITFEPPDVAGDCPFCGTAIVAQTHSANPVITPGGVLPFQFGRKQAQQKIRHWLGKLRFAPNGLKKMAQNEKLQGVYLPFWTYDSDTSNRYKGQRGEYYYVTVTYTDTDSEGKKVTKTRQERRTRWHSASGVVTKFFDDILIAATEAVNTKRLEQLEPWNLEKIAPYDPSYLAGFKAQRYQTNLKDGFEIAKSKMVPDIRSAICRDIGGDTQRIHSIKTTYHQTTFKHILLPVWMASYRFKNKRYQVMINAQTGEVLGDRPWSVLKIAAAVLSVSLVALVIFLARTGQLSFDFRPESQPRRSNPTQPVLPPPNSAPTTPAQPPSETTPSPTSTDEAFRRGINIATNAANRTQTAQSLQEWEQVANLWIQSIEQLKQVPASSPNYAIAQQKVQNYQANLNYARQQIEQRQ